MFDDLITSKSRVKLLNVFLSVPSEMYHVRELVRRTNDEINAVRRELQLLEKKGILIKEPRANRVYYSLSKNYPFYFDLLQMGIKTIGLGYEILKNRAKLGRIKYTMFSGRFAKRVKKESEEKRLGTEINYTAMSDEEFEFRKKKRDPFIYSILVKSRVMLIGDEESMIS